MDEKYHVEVTSRDSGEVEDIPLSSLDDTKGTRRIIRPKIVNNVHETTASVELELIHQKRHQKNAPWEDADKFSLATLKSGQEVRFGLDTTETWRLKEALNHLFAIGINGVPAQNTDFVAIPAQRVADSLIVQGAPRDVLENLLNEHGDGLWQILEELQPGLLSTIALKHLTDKRRRTVAKFREVLESGAANEREWQKFFARNLWIFGHGLDYRILDLVQEQPNFGGTTVTGKGAHRGDYLMATRADVRFTVLVDIKTPGAALVEPEPYRNKVHKVGADVAGGVAQLQGYCRTWITEGARKETTAEQLAENNICTYEPKSILIIGHTGSLDTRDKRASFEMFRRNLHNPEILTFDELLARAEFIVGDGDESTNS